MRPFPFRPAAFAAASAAVALTAAGPRSARAQPTTRTFEACVYGPFQTCSSPQLTTTHTPPFTLGFPLFGGTQYVAGCAGGAFASGRLTTALVTCLPGAYRFQALVGAWLLALAAGARRRRG